MSHLDRPQVTFLTLFHYSLKFEQNVYSTDIVKAEASLNDLLTGVYVSDQLHEANGWEGKGDFLYKMELAADMAVKSLTLSHLTHIWWLRGVPLLTVSPFRLLDAILFLDIRHLIWSIRANVRYTALIAISLQTHAFARFQVTLKVMRQCSIYCYLVALAYF